MPASLSAMLGDGYSVPMLDAIAREMAPAFGWAGNGGVSESASPNLL